MKIKSHHSPQKDRNPAEEGQRELEAPVWLRRFDEWKGVTEPAHEGQALKEVWVKRPAFLAQFLKFSFYPGLLTGSRLCSEQSGAVKLTEE